MVRNNKRRAHRPDLERVAPIRDFSRIFGPPTTNGTTPPKRRVDPTARGATPRDDVQRGVTLGYQVIEDYMRQGEQFARAAYGSSGMFGFAGRSVGAPQADAADFRPTAGRMIEMAADLVAAWMDLMQSAPASRAPQAREAPPGGVPPFDIDRGHDEAADGARAGSKSSGTGGADEQRPGRPPPITLHVRSKQPVEVTLDLTPGPTPGPLVAHDLRAVDSAAARIGGVTVEQVAGVGREPNDRVPGFVVRLRLDDKHPPGVYSGLVVDPRTNTPRGSLSVRVLSKSAPRATKR